MSRCRSRSGRHDHGTALDNKLPRTWQGCHNMENPQLGGVFETQRESLNEQAIVCLCRIQTDTFHEARLRASRARQTTQSYFVPTDQSRSQTHAVADHKLGPFETLLSAATTDPFDRQAHVVYSSSWPSSDAVYVQAGPSYLTVAGRLCCG